MCTFGLPLIIRHNLMSQDNSINFIFITAHPLHLLVAMSIVEGLISIFPNSVRLFFTSDGLNCSNKIHECISIKPCCIHYYNTILFNIWNY